MDKGKIMFKLNQVIIVVLGFSAAIGTVQAGPLTVPNAFSAGTKAVAADVNANFSAVKGAVNDNDARIASMEAAIAALEATVSAQASTIATLQNDLSSTQSDLSSVQSDLSSVQGNSVLALDGNLSYTIDANGYATALFSGVNLQVNNGVGQSTPNGVGNIIVGYNNIRTGSTGNVCSDGERSTQFSCEINGGIWAVNHKTGSHNLVAGDNNSYSRVGGVVFGARNVINRNYSSVSGGADSTASGLYSSVSGGSVNTASAEHSSVSGGWQNTASGGTSSVGGGRDNVASGSYQSISGEH